MKKKLLIALLAIASTVACTFGVAACFTTSSNGGNGGNQSGNQQGGNEGEQNKNEYTVIFDANGGKFQKGEVEIDDDVTFDDGSVVSADGKKMTVTVSKGGLLAPPLKIPERSGYAFDGWYSDAECENEYVFDQSPLNGRKTLYAKWSITFNYALSADKSYYIVKGIGGLEGDVEVPDTYNLLPVLEIADGAFNKCNKLTGIAIADSVTKIGSNAFSECKNLVKATLGNGVTEIGASAFDGGWTGSGLKEITIPASVEFIGKDAFSVCTNLEKVIYGGTIDDWCNIEFAENSADSDAVLAHNNTVLYIDDKPVIDATINNEKVNARAFTCYNALKSVTLGDKVKTVGEDAFFSSGITSLTLNGATALTEIGVKAFNNISIKSLNLPATDVYVGEEAFASCDYLTSIDLGGVKRIANKAFYGLLPITSLNLGVVEEIGDEAFGFEQNTTSIKIPSTLWFIGHRNFSNVKSVSFESADDWYANFSQSVSWGSGLSSTHECVEISASTLSNGIKAAQLFKNSVTDYDRGYHECDWVRKAGDVTVGTRWDDSSRVLLKGVYTDGRKGGIIIPDNVMTMWDNHSWDPNREFVPSNAGSGVGSSTPEGVTAVFIGKNLEDASFKAFGGWVALKKVFVSDENKNLAVQDNVVYNKKKTEIVAVPGGLEGDITIADGVTEITSNEFNRNSRYDNEQYDVNRIVIPNTVIEIGENALVCCNNVIIIPESVKSVGKNAVAGVVHCVAKNKPDGWDDKWDGYARHVIWDCNHNDKDENGYAYIVVGGLEYALKDGEATVCHRVNYLYDNVKIFRTIEYQGIDYKVTGIGDSVFERDSDLSITIPDSVVSIGAHAFYDCEGLTIVYNGTKTQWNKIEKGFFCFQKPGAWFIDYTIHYTKDDDYKDK